jgi:uncharacterized protein
LATSTTIAFAAPAPADPSGGSNAALWQSAVDAPDRYPGMAVEWDVPITLSD